MKSKENLKKRTEIIVDTSEDKKEHTSVLDSEIEKQDKNREIDEDELDKIAGAAFIDTEFGKSAISGIIGISAGVAGYTGIHALQKNKTPDTNA